MIYFIFSKQNLTLEGSEASQLFSTQDDEEEGSGLLKTSPRLSDKDTDSPKAEGDPHMEERPRGCKLIFFIGLFAVFDFLTSNYLNFLLAAVPVRSLSSFFDLYGPFPTKSIHEFIHYVSIFKC